MEESNSSSNFSSARRYSLVSNPISPPTLSQNSPAFLPSSIPKTPTNVSTESVIELEGEPSFEFRKLVENGIYQSQMKQKENKYKEKNKDSYLQSFSSKSKNINYSLSEQKIFFPHERYIHISVNQLVNYFIKFILNREKKSEEADPFFQFAGLFYYVLLSKEMRQKNYLYESVFNPARQINFDIEAEELKFRFENGDQEHKIEIQNQFLNHFIDLMRQAGFLPLSKSEFEFCDAIKISSRLSGIPVEVDWNQIDSELLSKYFSELNIIDLDQFNSRCLVFWRGANMETKEGTFVLEKLDLLLKKFTNFFGLLTNSENETNSLQKLESSKPDFSCIHERKSFRRHTLQSLNFWEKETIQEPYFEEVVLLYRKKVKDQSTTDINIQRFYNIPLKDLKIIFPAKKVGRNWADFVSILMLLSGIVTICFKLFSVWAQSTYLDEAFMTILFLLLPYIIQQFLKRFVGQRSAQRLHHQMVTDTLLTKNLNCNKSVLSYIRDCARNQELKEILLCYFILWKWKKGLTAPELDSACEYFLKTVFQIETDFEIENAISRMTSYEIIYASKGKYFAQPIDECITKLHKILQVSSTQTFVPENWKSSNNNNNIPKSMIQ